MAIVLKEGCTYNPEKASTSAGISLAHGDYYAHIKEYLYNSKDKTLSFVLYIFGNKEVRDAEDSQPIDSIGFNINPNVFDDEVGSSGVTIPDLYALALKHPSLVDWQSDEL